MKIIEYEFDIENLEILAKAIWSKPNIVFHGTTSYHSDNIEKNGFVVNHIPFDIDKVKILIKVLETDGFSKYDDVTGNLNTTTVEGIRNYINTIENRDLRLSFTPLSYLSARYSSSETKGGQIFRLIRKAKMIIDVAIKENKLEDQVPEEVYDIFTLLNDIDNSDSIVYVIELSKDLVGIECDVNNVIHSSNSLSPEHIIGKVIVPSSFGMNVVEEEKIKLKLRSKLYFNNGIGLRILKS